MNCAAFTLITANLLVEFAFSIHSLRHKVQPNASKRDKYTANIAHTPKQLYKILCKKREKKRQLKCLEIICMDQRRHARVKKILRLMSFDFLIYELSSVLFHREPHTLLYRYVKMA